MTVAIVADITPRPLRTKADSVQKIVGYADTGVMLVAISVMVPNVERPDYLPLFLLQAAFVLVSAVAYFWQGQKLDMPAIVGMAMIVGGVLVINLFSKTAGH